MMGSAKRQAITKQTVFDGCPSQYSEIYTYVSCLSDADPIDYELISKKLEQAWKDAGVTEIGTKYDFETRMRAPDQNGY